MTCRFWKRNSLFSGNLTQIMAGCPNKDSYQLVRFNQFLIVNLLPAPIGWNVTFRYDSSIPCSIVFAGL
jgi:hypothetical protein